MEQRIGSTNGDVVAAWVMILRDLEQEVRTATTAIARNRLADLEESLWRQETLCSTLKRSIVALRLAKLSAAPTVHLRDAATDLRAQTLIYEKLVAQSSRSTAILQHLCSLYRNAAQHPARAMHRSISREA